MELVGASHRVLRRLKLLSADQASVAEYVQAHARFHEILVSRCSNPWLMWMRQLLFAQSVRYRHYCVPFASEKAEFYDVNGPFLRAVLALDATIAERLLVEQYQRVCALICELLADRVPD